MAQDRNFSRSDRSTYQPMRARAAGNTQAEERCYEIRRRAERKAAKLYDQQEKAKGGRLPPDKRAANQTLAELGIPTQRMAEWRKMAKVPDRQFDAAFAKGGKPSIERITGHSTRQSARAAFARRSYVRVDPSDGPKSRRCGQGAWASLR